MRFRDPRDYQARLRELLGEAVATSLGDTGATRIALSGGLDSSTIAAMAALVPGAEIGAYSMIAPGYPEANEEPWMRHVIDQTGMSWRPVEVEASLPFTELPGAPLGERSASVIGAGMIRLVHQLMADNGVSTVLRGDGGDAVLCAAEGPIPTHLADPLFEGRPFEAFSGLRRWMNGDWRDRPWMFWASRALGATTLAHLTGRQPGGDSAIPLPPWLVGDYSRRMKLERRPGRRIATRCRTPGQQVVWDTVWRGALSVSTGRVETLSTRRPLLHRPLVEFMQAIPWEEKIRPRCDRLLQRRALKGILPEAIRRRAGKITGSWPFIEGLARSRLWRDYLCDDPCVAKAGFVTKEAWRLAVAQAATGQTHGDFYFLTMVGVEAWLKGRESSNVQLRPPGPSSTG